MVEAPHQGLPLHFLPKFDGERNLSLHGGSAAEVVFDALSLPTARDLRCRFRLYAFQTAPVRELAAVSPLACG